MPLQGFELAHGSVVGRRHLGTGNNLVGMNNQDAVSVRHDDALIALVADGCGSSPHSEIGARVGSALLSAVLLQQWRLVQQTLKSSGNGSDPLSQSFWDRVEVNSIAALTTLAQSQALTPHEFGKVVVEQMLFTTLGFMLTQHGLWIFSPAGADGVYALNGDVTQLTPQEGNEPIYSMYRTIPNRYADRNELLRMKVHHYLPLTEVQSVLVGSDGVGELIRAEGMKIPGKQEVVPALRALWEGDRFFEDSAALTLLLRSINSESTRLETQHGKARLTREPGLLMDDTSLVVVRRLNGTA